MNVKEFVENKERAIEKIEIKTKYVSYVNKVAQCKQIVDMTSHVKVKDRMIYVSDSPMRNLFLKMKIVEAYTNIEFQNDEVMSAYDIMEENGIFRLLFEEYIPDDELSEWHHIIGMVLDDLHENERSMVAVFDNIKEVIGLAATNVFGGIENAISETLNEDEIKQEF